MFRTRSLILSLITAAALAALAAQPGLAGTTERVSVSSAGEQGNSGSTYPAVSADGRFVAFDSWASNLVPGDTNDWGDVFVRDRVTGTTERFSTNDIPFDLGISTDGRFVTFTSGASNLVPGDTNGLVDVFVRDRLTGTTERVSVSDSEEQANGASYGFSISADGKFVSFGSLADNLVPGDTNGWCDVFVRDRAAGTTERVSVSSAEEQGNWDSDVTAISADGKFVAFQSRATNLVPGDTNIYGSTDVFVRDTIAGTTERVSVSSTGEQGNNGSRVGAISADGRFVAFDSSADNLVPEDTNGMQDVFVRDRIARTTERVSVSSAGAQGDFASQWLICISADGRFVAFSSWADNLVPGDTNGAPDDFVRDRLTETTERVSVSSAGAQADSSSGWLSISADGRFVAFESLASNLVPGDTNGYWDIFVRDRTLAINGDAATTDSRSVALSIIYGNWVEMRFRNDPGAWSAWEACAATKAWTLLPCNATKRVYVQFRDAAHVESATSYDEIVLQAAPPVGLSITINGGAACADSADVTLTVAATGAAEMRFRNETGAWSAWEPFATTKAWTLSASRGTKTVGFQVGDGCGNTAAELTDTIVRPTFDDVQCASSQRPFVEALARAGITRGCSASPPLFCPYANVTRAQMAALVCRAAGKQPLDRDVPTFADVPKTHWAYGYVERLADPASWGGNAPTSGCRAWGTARHFCPNDPVTREQMAKCLCIAAGKSPMASCSGVFADVYSAGWACAWIERLADPGSWGGATVTSGCACPAGYPLGAKCYCPKSAVTRAQMAKFLCLAFGILY